MLPIPVDARSKAWVCSRSLAGTAVSNPAGDMDVCFFECRVFSGRSLCVGLITRPEEPYRVSECGSEASIIRSWPTRGCCAMEGK